MVASERGVSAALDDLDRLIVGELAGDGRVTSTDLAAQAGVSKATAASRVRRLIEAGVVRVTAVFDVDAAGFQWQVNCFIKSKGGGGERDRQDVGRASADMGGEQRARVAAMWWRCSCSPTRRRWRRSSPRSCRGWTVSLSSSAMSW